MEAMRFGRFDVWLYRSTMHTSSPLLKEIYIDSHRFEPWAVDGSPERAGRVAFPQVLYVDHEERERLLDRVRARAVEPSFAPAIERRFIDAARVVVRDMHAVRAALRRRRRARSRAATLRAPVVNRLIEGSARLLSIGLLKEALAPDDARALLGGFMPTRGLEAALLALYQPLCLPHFLKLELKLLFFASRRGRDVRLAIDACAHHNRFALEENELHDPHVMRDRLDALLDRHGGRRGVREERRRLLLQHASAVRASYAAEALILQRGATADASLATRRAVLAITRLLQLVATWEEQKHILVVEAARVLSSCIAAAGLCVEAADRERLLDALER